MILKEQKILLKNGQKCTLRSPRAEDAEKLIEYLKITAEETKFLLKEVEEVQLTVEQEKEFLQQMVESESDMMILAEVDGEIAGNCSFSSVGRTMRTQHRCSMGIALCRKYWSLGIGTVLLGTLLEQAKACGYEQAELGVMNKNQRAIRLYEKVGFEKVGCIPRAMKYKDGTYDDEIMMVKELK